MYFFVAEPGFGGWRHKGSDPVGASVWNGNPSRQSQLDQVNSSILLLAADVLIHTVPIYCQPW